MISNLPARPLLALLLVVTASACDRAPSAEASPAATKIDRQAAARSEEALHQAAMLRAEARGRANAEASLDRAAAEERARLTKR